MEEETADWARDSKLQVEPKDVTKLLQSHDKILVNKELLLMNEQRKSFLDMESTPSEEDVKIIEM